MGFFSAFANYQQSMTFTSSSAFYSKEAVITVSSFTLLKSKF